MPLLPYRLVVFDCDGTLADSGPSIVHAVRAAFAELGLRPPSEREIRRRVGLSLDHFVASLGVDPAVVDTARLLRSYREHFSRYRAHNGTDPFFDGIDALLDDLLARKVLLGVATGKSRRGLRRLLEDHGRLAHFVTLQTSDDAPSKPDPTMIRQALDECAVEAEQAVVVGDTVYDVEAAVRAGVDAVGVAWGHHEPDELRAAGAGVVATDRPHLRRILGLDAGAPQPT